MSLAFGLGAKGRGIGRTSRRYSNVIVLGVSADGDTDALEVVDAMLHNLRPGTITIDFSIAGLDTTRTSAAHLVAAVALGSSTHLRMA